ncbi:MAG: Hsp20/alpha crystallin family protein [Desulfobacteraceae bacterium]|nr:Hsp20/alpha crystallin family protein [Desulfobacteraceae bacterium]
MDQSRKSVSKQFAEMEKQMGRMLRNMSLARMGPFQAGNDWMPSADVYETETEVVVCLEISGIEPRDISVLAEPRSVTVTGDRRFPPVENASCVHQLEIEHGHFERTIPLPVAVDVADTSSIYRNGYLLIRLPKLGHKGKITVQVG